MEPLRIGVIGCGAISGAYLGMARHFPIVQIVAAADVNRSAAEAKAKEFRVPRVCSVDEMLADPSIELILNLTVPQAHAAISLAALKAGKHAYSEKPLGISRDEGKKILAAAASKGFRIGCAPDTFLGAGIQTARKLIDQGVIGRPVACDDCLHDEPRPRKLASQSGVLLRAGRGADVRHGAVLSHCAALSAGKNPPAEWDGVDRRPRAHDHEQAEGRQQDYGTNAGPCRRHHGIRKRRRRIDHSDVRHLASDVRAGPADHDLRDGGADESPRSESIRRPGFDPAGQGFRLARCPASIHQGLWQGGGTGRHGILASAWAVRTGAMAIWRLPCWTRCRDFSIPHRAGRITGRRPNSRDPRRCHRILPFGVLG